MVEVSLCRRMLHLVQVHSELEFELELELGQLASSIDILNYAPQVSAWA